MNILWWCFSIFAVESFRSCTTAIFVLPNCFWHISPAFFWKVISLGGHGSGSDSWQSVFESILCVVVLPSCVNTSFRPSHPNFRGSVFNLMSLHLEQLPSVNKVDYTFRTNIRLWLWLFSKILFSSSFAIFIPKCWDQFVMVSPCIYHTNFVQASSLARIRAPAISTWNVWRASKIISRIQLSAARLHEKLSRLRF